MRRSWLTLCLSSLALGCTATEPVAEAPSKVCLVRRAAFDIGSATTKVKVADVDVCRHRELAVLYSSDAPVFYRDDVDGGSGGRFAESTMERGLETLAGFRARAAAFDPAGYAGVATSAFRLADNGSRFASRIESDLGIPITIIDQGQEAWLGFMGAVRAAGVEPQHAVVWDIGGRSMQMTTVRPDGRMVIYRGKFASGQMRDFVTREVQKRAGGTPNPMNRREAEAALAYAEALASEEIVPAMQAKLSDPATRVVGIGALKYYGDGAETETTAACSRRNLELTINELLHKTDAQIGGDYASTQLSDRILIVGFMRALGVERVALAEIDLTDALLFEAQYWHQQAPQRQGSTARATLAR